MPGRMRAEARFVASTKGTAHGSLVSRITTRRPVIKRQSSGESTASKTRILVGTAGQGVMMSGGGGESWTHIGVAPSAAVFVFGTGA